MKQIFLLILVAIACSACSQAEPAIQTSGTTSSSAPCPQPSNQVADSTSQSTDIASPDDLKASLSESNTKEVSCEEKYCPDKFAACEAVVARFPKGRIADASGQSYALCSCLLDNGLTTTHADESFDKVFDYCDITTRQNLINAEIAALGGAS